MSTATAAASTAAAAADSPFSERARHYMRPWLFPVAKAMYELALEHQDDDAAFVISSLANEEGCITMSTVDQLRTMKRFLRRSPHVESYLPPFRSAMEKHGVVIDGF